MKRLTDKNIKDAAERWIKDCTDHICVYCKHIFGGCEWVDENKPVDGWKAEKHYRQGIGTVSYQVVACPKFQYGSMCTECKHGGEDLTEHRPDLCKHYRPQITVSVHRTRCVHCVKGMCEYTDKLCTIPDDMLPTCSRYYPRRTTKLVPDACVSFERREKHWKSVK